MNRTGIPRQAGGDYYNSLYSSSGPLKRTINYTNLLHCMMGQVMYQNGGYYVLINRVWHDYTDFWNVLVVSLTWLYIVYWHSYVSYCHRY